MKRALIVLVVVAVLVIGLGFVRGWFAVTGPAADTSKDKVNVNLTMDSGKMQKDANAVHQRTAEIAGRVTAGTNDSGNRTTGSK